MFSFCEAVPLIHLYQAKVTLINSHSDTIVHENYFVENEKWCKAFKSLLQKYTPLLLNSVNKYISSTKDYFSIDSNDSTEENDCIWMLSAARHNRRIYRVKYPSREKVEKKNFLQTLKYTNTSYIFNTFTSYSSIANSNLKVHPPPWLTPLYRFA